MMKKRIIAAALSLLLCCFGANALAKTETKYGLTISSENGDWEFFDEGKLAITEAGSYTLSGSGKHVVVRDVRGDVCITLDNLTLYQDAGCNMKIDNSVKTILILKGKNSMSGGYRNTATLDHGKNPLEITCTGCEDKNHNCGELDVTFTNLWGAAIGSGSSVPCANLTISGGIITATADSAGAAIGSGWNASCTNLTISGGTVTATSSGTGAAIGSGNEGDASSITISGGIVNATNNGTGAAIGSGENGDANTITISGGTVTAAGRAENESGAAIGSGAYGKVSNITISGGKISATARDGAGIGSGYNASAQNITISGGDIYVHGDGYGAGIGSSKASAKNITISGGTIYSKGGMYGAGIGSGSHADCSNITISGGNVTAIGGAKGAAGIGSAGYGNAENITISGGNISAKSMHYGPGIGAGRYGSANNITITGGNIEAAGGSEKTDGIGAGYNGTASNIVIAPSSHRIEASVSNSGFDNMTELEGSPFAEGSTDVTDQVSGFQFFKTVGEHIGAIDMPETGDSASLALWTCMLSLSGALLALMKRRTAG